MQVLYLILLLISMTTGIQTIEEYRSLNSDTDKSEKNIKYIVLNQKEWYNTFVLNLS